MAFTSIRLRNLLSFRELELELRPLNVLIGPNASGKSNLIDAIELLRGAPVDFHRTLTRSGLPREWVWRAGAEGDAAELEATLDAPRPMAYRLVFQALGDSSFAILSESLLAVEEAASQEIFTRTSTELTVRGTSAVGRTETWKQGIPSQQAALQLLASPLAAKEPAAVGERLRAIRIYRNWDTGRTSRIRQGVSAAEPGEHLEEDGSNLALVLNRLEPTGVRDRIAERLGDLVDGFEKLFTIAERGAMFLRIRERNLGLIPATRLSDGTLRFLCLMAALFDPDPPPLICIEEPEIGLHPDALQLVAEALREASERTQIIVTTHSEALVDALSADPESVLVCEKDLDNSTRIQRLEADRLARWLERYRLGELWRKGEIGGNRW